MHSIFTRVRTASTPNNARLLSPIPDELGRVTSRGSVNGPGTPSKKGKKDKDKDKDRRGRTLSSPGTREEDDGLASLPDGSFLPLCLSPPIYDGPAVNAGMGSDSGHGAPPPVPAKEHEYGYLHFDRHVVLGIEQANHLVEVISHELSTRGLTTPFLFSTLALDLTHGRIKRLVESFMKICTNPSVENERLWREEAQFAEPADLAMCLRWGLARIVRIVGGQEVRGFLAYGDYLAWRDTEVAAHYPAGHFQLFLQPLLPPVRSLFMSLLTLLTRLTSHSNTTGHTPVSLSPLFGPLLFGLGLSTLAFHHTYANYLRAAHATEHLLLSFVRFQELQQGSTLALPSRLKEWIRGYPAMLTSGDKLDQPRRGARTTRVAFVRRNVRMYSGDIVRTSASWAARGSEFGRSKVWERVSPRALLALPPKYADSYRKRMDLPMNYHPDMGVASSLHSASATPSTSSSTGSTLVDDKDFTPEERFKNLTDLKWGEFEMGGFGGTDDKKLQFDLTEGARSAHHKKRQTMSWNDFSSAGFSRPDDPLSAALQFGAPVTHTITSWPTQSAEIQRKLKKTQKALPAFGWDTDAVLAGEEIIEEGFLDVFCDLIYSTGWMDRTESTFRDCNWALVEFKSIPEGRSTPDSGVPDPRTSSMLFLFEEFVPLEYRTSLSAVRTKKRRLPEFFSPSKSKAWKAATTLNGRPYVVGHVPRSPTPREIEFEGLLSNGALPTKVISLKSEKNLGRSNTTATAISIMPTSPRKPVPPMPPMPVINEVKAADATRARATPSPTPTPGTPTPPPPPKKVEEPYAAPPAPTASSADPELVTSPAKRSRFQVPGSINRKRREQHILPAQYDEVDFETAVADPLSSDEEVAGVGKGAEGAERRNKKRDSMDEPWMDILVGSQRRMSGQTAEMRKPTVRPGGPRMQRKASATAGGGAMDADAASRDLERALADVPQHPPTDDEGDMEPVRAPFVTSPTSGGGFAEDQDGVTPDDDEPVIPTRRLASSYFDLHPDRRPVVVDRVADLAEESAQRISSQLDRDEVAASMDASYTLHNRHDSSTYSESGFEPMSEPPTAAGDGTFPDTPADEFARANGHSKKDSLTLPGVGVPMVIASPAPSKPAGKTAALIEMYRQREAASSTPPLRIPARGASLGSSSSPSRTPEADLAKAVDAPPAAVPASGSETSDEEDDALVPPTGMIAELEAGRGSPSRYIHGMPLHNVVEEEEEDA